MNWSESYKGVQHVVGLCAGFQITLIDRETFCEVFLLNFTNPNPFEPTKYYTGTRQDCIGKAERWYEGIINRPNDNIG